MKSQLRKRQSATLTNIARTSLGDLRLPAFGVETNDDDARV